MPNIEESNTSQDIFRQTSCSVKFKDKVSKGNCHFNQTGYSKGFFAKNQDSDWIDQKALQMHMTNEDTKQNIRPRSTNSNQQKKKKGQAVRHATEQTDDLEIIQNDSQIAVNKVTQNKRKKSSIQVIKNAILNPSQQAYLQRFRTILPQKSFFQCLIRRTNSLTQSKFSLIYKNQEILTIAKSEGINFGNKIDICCITLPNKLGTLKSNFIRSNFNFYQSFAQFSKPLQIIMICYKDQPLFSYNPRKIQIFLLKDPKNINIASITDNNQKNLKQRYQQGQTTTITKLKTRQALKDQKNNYYLQLDKSAIPSVKNTILEDQQGRQVLKFIKVGQNQFKLQVKTPFSILSAYAFAVTSLIFKLASQ